MEVTCPACGQAVAASDVNVGKDLAYCRRCNEAFSLSAMAGVGGAGVEVKLPPVNLDDPPAGCTFVQTPQGFEVTATTRSWVALFLIPFAIAWNSFLVFFLFMISKAGEDESGLPSGGVIFMGLFMIPFVIAGLVQIAMALMMLFGQVRVTVESDQASVYTGVFGAGRVRRFDWSGVTRVAEQSLPMRTRHGGAMPPGTSTIVLEGQRRIVLGRMLSAERIAFVAAALRQMLAERDGGRRGRL